MGGSGTGKAALANVIVGAFARASMFVEDRILAAGRAELAADDLRGADRGAHETVSRLKLGPGRPLHGPGPFDQEVEH